MSTGVAYDVSSTETPPQKKMETDRSPLINRGNPLAEGFFEGILRPCVAEFVATTMFVFIGTMSVHSTTQHVGLNDVTDFVGIALAHGFAIALLVAATGAVSGGHINPAVTFGVWLSGGIPTLKAILYMISQLVGGLLGASLTRGVLTEGSYKAIKGGATDLGPGTSAAQGLLCEVILTTILVSVVLLAAVDSDTKSSLGAMAIGFAVGVDILAGAQVSGGSMNPARSFGPAVAVSTYNDDVWSYHWVYWVGPALGAALASFIYRIFLAGPEGRIFNYGNGGAA